MSNSNLPYTQCPTGIFSDDEIDFCVEGEEVVSGDSHLSCLSLVAFEGFTSSSVSVIDGGDASQEILARCSQPTTGSLDLHELYDVPGGENDSIGVLFPLKVGFDFEYNFLISHDEQFRVNGLEGEFDYYSITVQSLRLDLISFLGYPHSHLS